MAKMTKEEATRMLAAVPAENVFWCHDGSIFKTIEQLKEGLARMSDETFAFHVTVEKNDFSNWVGTTVKNNKLATDLSKAGNRTLAVKRVEDRVVFLRSRLA
jgi:hypothetical protein